MSISDYLWGGGKLTAPSPEVASPVPPSKEEQDRFFTEAEKALHMLSGVDLPDEVTEK